jgi:hypothetical protein
MPAPQLSLLLSQEEWRTCFAMQWVATEYGAWGREEQSDGFATLGSGLKWAITLLAQRGGYRFKSLRVDDDGTIFPRQDGVVEPGNLLYVQKVAAGRPVDFLRHVQAAIGLFEREGVTLSVEPLRQAAAEIEWSLKAADEDMDKTEKREIAQALKKVLYDGQRLAQGGGLRV